MESSINKNESMKKVLMLITKGEIGGAQVFVRDLAIEFKKNDIDITVGIGPDDNNFLKQELKEEKIPSVTFYNLSRTLSPFRNFFFVLEIWKYLKDNKFNVLHLNSSNTLFATVATLFLREKPYIVFTHHGLSYLDPNSKKSFQKIIFKLIFRALLPIVDKNIFVTESNYKTALLSGLVKDGVVIKNGVLIISQKTKEESITFFEKTTSKSLKDSVIIGSVGRLAYPKNYELLIEVAPKILESAPNTKFILIGDGPEKEKYLDLIQKNRLKNSFFVLGSIKNASLYLTGFDVFVLPSIYEGMSLTLIEAMRTGLPIIASAVEGNLETLFDDKNQLFDIENKIELIEKLTDLVNNISLRKQYGEKNKKTSENYTVENVAKKYIELFCQG